MHRGNIRGLTVLAAVGVMVALMAPAAMAEKPTGFDNSGKALGLVKDTGFDEYGYNDRARIFSGPLEGWCQSKLGTSCSTTAYAPYANDHLVMKWNAEWDRGNAEGWENPPYDAWITNEWNGMVPGGSGEIWHNKIVWIGDCQATVFDDGGRCIWNQFEELMSQGVVDGAHEWDIHVTPNGFGN